jgi:predicted RND superfamily exporter protein
MGKLLMLSLFYTLVCTFFVLPALLGPVKQEQPAATLKPIVGRRS